MTVASPRDILLSAFDVAVTAGHPRAIVESSEMLQRLRHNPLSGRAVVLGAGKASAAMAAALEAAWPLRSAPAGFVVTPDGYSATTRCIEVATAAHPHPDARGCKAAMRMADIVATLTPDDIVIALISGGGSALLTWPVEGVSLEALRAVLRDLMAAGADIASLNTVRKHLSRLAGGGLAARLDGAHVEALIVSDVVGDDPALVASGPVSPDPTTLADASAVLERFGVRATGEIAAALADARNETPKPGHSAFQRVRCETVSSSIWISAVSMHLERAGYAPRVLDRQMAGDVGDVARIHAEEALRCAGLGRAIALVSGGEATASVRGRGEGGPNAEMSLELARALKGAPDIWALTCDSDGVDGASDAAGGIVGPDTLTRAAGLGFTLEAALACSDSTGLLKRLGDAVVTGPTMTNVNDVRIVLIGRPGG